MTDLLFVLAVLLVAVGAGLIYTPAGLIVAGLLLLGTLVYIEKRTVPAPPEARR